MLFLAIAPSATLYDDIVAQAPGLNATVYPDFNVWAPVLSSWYYQLFVRIIPSTILVGAGCAAAVFFAAHMLIIHERFKDESGQERRSIRRWVRFVSRAVDLPHFVLFTELTTATLAGVVTAVDGFQSTPTLPCSVVNYFLTLLAGWSFACSMACATVWVRKLGDLMPGKQQSLVTRVVSGEYPVVYALLNIVPVILDTSISICFAMYYFPPLLTAAASGVLMLMQIVLSCHVLTGVAKYSSTAAGIQARSSSSAGHEASVDRFLVRLSRCALGLSLSTIMYCVGAATIGLVPAYANTPSGWTVSWALAYTGRALDSAFRVAIFQPKLGLLLPSSAKLRHIVVQPSTRPVAPSGHKQTTRHH